MTRFLSLDPASTVSGWALFDGGGLIAWGKIDTKKVEYSFRYQFIINELNCLVQKYHFQEIAVETAPRWKGREIAALKVVFISVRKWAKQIKVPMSAYNVATWKTAVLGNCHYSKERTAETIRLILPGLPAGLGEHEFDAIGIGIHHAGEIKLRGMGSK
jgi:Holliday junction resolvasome RuvABC endonuclease subunit